MLDQGVTLAALILKIHVKILFSKCDNVEYIGCNVSFIDSLRKVLILGEGYGGGGRVGSR